MAMMAITTNNSISVNAERGERMGHSFRGRWKPGEVEEARQAR
jgi:hypothetical protein